MCACDSMLSGTLDMQMWPSSDAALCYRAARAQEVLAGWVKQHTPMSLPLPVACAPQLPAGLVEAGPTHAPGGPVSLAALGG